MMIRLALACVGAWTTAALAGEITLDTGDGLQVSFSDLDGAVTGVSVNGKSAPLIMGESGGLSARVAQPIAPHVLQHLDFDSGYGPVSSAQNASWDGIGSYVNWIPNGGQDNSGHLLLGDGVAQGVGMALDSAIPVTPGGKLRISWQARSASVKTTHILCIRIYDALGQDITSVSNVPSGWSYTGTSLAHGVWGFECSQPDTWEYFERTYQVSTDAAFVRVSLRHWTGGDHLLHIDDFDLDVIGGVVWSDRVAIVGPLSTVAGGFSQSTEIAGQNIQVDSTTAAADGRLNIDVALQDTSAPQSDRALQLAWTLPIAADGLRWWDDIDTSRQIAPGALFRNTFDHNRHAISFYPFSAVTTDDFGLSLVVPQDGFLVQRFEYDASIGLSCVWEIGLSPVTAKLGPGRATTSMSVLHHDPAWGFRAAADRYYNLYPEYFMKRTTREGAWMYPIHPSQIPNPLDFGFAFLETHPMSQDEHMLCDQLGIGVFYYTEPWAAWQPWGELPAKPPYEERVARIDAWAAAPATFVTWQPNGGVNDSAHLLLGDGQTTGAGMATSNAFWVFGGDVLDISWQARALTTESTQIVSARLFDANGADITSATPAPTGWFWSSGSQAHVIAGLVNTTTNAWEPFSCVYELPTEVSSMRVSIRHWNGGDHFIHIDELRVGSTFDAVTYLLMPFDYDDQLWASAHNANWNAGDATWLRAQRQQTAQAVINASPLDAEGRYFIDGSPYFWHEWGGVVGSWNQAWPINPDPDLASPNTFELYASDAWIYRSLDQNAGVYLDSVTTGSISGWENHRADHLAVADSPLTFSWDDGAAAQIAPQAQTELLAAVSEEVRSRGKLMMLNIFPDAMRFHSHHGDILGSETSQIVESGGLSRIRRTLANHRIVSNLPQWGWNTPNYITYDQMEEFIRSQLFWGFYPAVSSGGGAIIGGAPDRYFLRPELYERDRPLFQSYIPIIRELSSAGWEPLTCATATPTAEIERFGDFVRGPVLLTVRDSNGAAMQAEVTLDLGASGLASPAVIEVSDVLADLILQVEQLNNPARGRFNISLDAGAVGVYRVTVVSFPTGDFDDDGDVDLIDYGVFSECLSGPGDSPAPTPPTTSQDCLGSFDFDIDADVDHRDFSAFQIALVGV